VLEIAVPNPRKNLLWDDLSLSPMIDRLEKARVYDLLAAFYVAGAGLTPRELCCMAEGGCGEPFSEKTLEEHIREFRGGLSEEEHERLRVLFRRFAQFTAETRK